MQSLLNPSSFWLAVNVLLTKPHVVNKRVWGCRILTRVACKSVDSLIKLPLSVSSYRPSDPNKSSDYVHQVVEELNLCTSADDSEAAIELIIIELLPRNYSDNRAYQLVYLHKTEDIVLFCVITPKEYKQNLCPEFSYKFYISCNNVIELKALNDSDSESKAWIWLKEKVYPQFLKWCYDLDRKVGSKQICNDSLVLVSNDKYYLKYNDLKLKYGKEMVKIWPECTDPSKFVYEDIAIATYILLLWESWSSNGKKQSFIDLGCGNGLLVYILTKEGHKGCGLDVRKRHIWDLYPKDVILEEKTIVPSDTCLYPDSDWLIGNHSDELTPWIPVIAARSSYKCNFFLLPCCAYNFDGSKYQRKNSSKSQYTEYLEYVKEVSEKCGFRTQIDRLKIPSTKRICIVSNGRNYPKEQQHCNSSNVQKCIDESHNYSSNSENKQDSVWIENCKTRDPVERVRNCTQIDKSIIESIVKSIAKYLLRDHKNHTQWNAGKSVEISELVTIISQDQLNCLKSECGGLATLLKNNHHIFKVQSGKVQFRYPNSVNELCKISSNKKNKVILNIKKRPCWFHINHPQGCPLSNADCSFLHSEIK